MLFTATACLAMVVMAPKYAQRQRQLERRFQMRERLLTHQAQAGARAAAIAQDELDDLDADDFTAHPPLLVSLRPLLLACAAACFVGAFFFARQRRKVLAATHPAGSSPPS